MNRKIVNGERRRVFKMQRFSVQKVSASRLHCWIPAISKTHLLKTLEVRRRKKRLDEWGNYPLERLRLIELINQTDEKNILLLSGNVHYTEISKIQLDGYELIDFTSSGLTHTNADYAKAENSYRVGNAYDGINFGLIEIDWQDKDKIKLNLMAKNEHGDTVFEYVMAFNKYH